MAKNTKFRIKMQDGTFKTVEGIIVNKVWGIDKREDNYFYLTHIPTGILATNAKTQKILKELVNMAEMIDEDSLDNIKSAIIKFWNEREWKG